MSYNGWVNFEDLLKACGYSESSNNNNNNSSNTTDNCNNNGCNDVPYGFQSIHPELFVVVGEILGNIVAGNVPINLQNAIGNWLELVAQAILTFNAQQTYFQSGPGRYFNPKNYNVDNPFCDSDSTSSSNNSTSSENNDIYIDKIKSLEKQVQKLTNEINEIKILLKEK